MSTASLAGEFGDVAFAQVVHLCANARSTGTLILSSLGDGRTLASISFENGEMVDARCGLQVGLEAAYSALCLTEGSYRFDTGIRCQQRRIFTPLSSLLATASQHENDPTAEIVAQSAILEARPATAVMGAQQQPQLQPPPPPRPSSPLAKRLGIGLGVLGCASLAGVLLWRVFAATAADPDPQTADETAPATQRAPSGPSVMPLSGLQGVTDKEVVFGMAAPFSGPSRELGRQMKVGVEAAFAEANAGGGVHGRRLRLVTGDDGYEPSRTAGVMKNLFENERVFGIVGNVGTPTALVALPMALERKALFYGAFTGASVLRHDPPDRYVFNYRASYGEETASVVNYLVKVRHVRPEHIVVFAQEDAFGDAGYGGVVKTLRALRPDMKPAVRLGYKRNTIEVSEAVTRLRDRGIPVKAVIMVATYRAAAKFIEKVRDLYPNMIFTNVSFVGSTALAGELMLMGPRYAKGVIVTQVVPPVASQSTAVLAYKRALQASAPGEEMDFVSAEGYWSGKLLVEALRATGPNLDTEHLIDAFEKLHGIDLGIGSTINFGLSEHQGSHKVWGTQIDETGRFASIDLD